MDPEQSPEPTNRGCNNFMKMLSCFVCSEVFDEPKFLPSCGHVFCLRCLIKIAENRSSFPCPKCKVECTLPPEGPKGLTTSKDLEKVVVSLKSLRTEDPDTDSQQEVENEDDESCRHIVFAKSSVNCPHCSKVFCNSCKILHMERMKVEALSLGENAQNKLHSTIEELEKKIPDIRQSLRRQALHSEVHIKAAFQRLKDEVNAAIDDREKRLIAATAGAAENEFEKLAKTISHAKQAVEAVCDTMPNFKTQSVFTQTIEEISQMCLNMKRLTQHVDTIKSINYHNMRLSFKSCDAVKKNILQNLSELNESYLTLTEVDQSETEQLLGDSALFHKVATSGDLNAMKDIFSTKQSCSSEALQSLVNHKDPANFNRTALHQASSGGHLEMVRYLVEQLHAKNDIRDTSEMRSIPLQLAAANSHVDVVAYLMFPEGQQFMAYNAAALRVAIMKGHLSIVDHILTNRPSLLNIRAAGGKTLLMYASEVGHMAIVLLILQKGANMCESDNKGNTALHFACTRGHIDVVSYLLSMKPDLALCKNANNQTPYDVAVASQQHNLANFLLNTNNSGNTTRQ